MFLLKFDVIIYVFYFMEDNHDQCCNELNLNWKLNKISRYNKLMPIPIGIYQKLNLMNEYRIVYYNNDSDYYLFHNGNEWVVRRWCIYKIICVSHNYINLRTHNNYTVLINFHLKVGKLLKEPFILFKNSKCSNATCPANGGCTSSWISTVGDIYNRYDVYDTSISISCKGVLIILTMFSFWSFIFKYSNTF